MGKLEKYMKEMQELQEKTMEVRERMTEVLNEGGNDRLYWALSHKLDSLIAKWEKAQKKWSDVAFHDSL